MKKCLLVSTLLVYYLFTSGFIFEVTQSETTDKLDLPYSIALSAERTGISNITTQDDLNCAQWLKLNWDKKTPIIGDYHSYLLVQSYVTGYFFLTNNLRKGDLKTIPEDCYIVINSWNTNHQKYIEPIGIGTRRAYDLPVFKDAIAYQSGDSIVYLRQKPST